MARSNAALFPSPRGAIGTRTLAVAAVVAVVIVLMYATGALAKVRTMVGLGATAPTYQTSTVSRGDVTVAVTATGPIAAVEDLPLTFKSSGKLASINVQVGEKVTKGQVLAVLDQTDLKLSLEQAQATLAQNQANLAKLKAGPTSTQRDVAQASVDSARSAAADANASLAVTKQTSAQSVAVARAALNTANVGIATAQSNIATAQQQEKAGLAADQVALANAQKNLAQVKATVAANVPVLEQQVEKAKDDLYSQQVSRDAACGHPGASCDAANAQVASSQTALNTAQAQLTQGLKQNDQSVTQAQAQVSTAQSQVQSDQAKFAASIVSAQNALKSAQSQAQSAGVGLSQARAQAAATIQSAQAQVAQAEGGVKTAENNYNNSVAPSTPEDIAGAQAQVQNAQAGVQAAQNNLANATLVAPFSGTVATINGAVGQWITGGDSGTGFITLVSMNDLQITAQVNEADIAKVKIGDPVTFNVNAYPEKTFSGKVIQIQPVGTTVQNVVDYNVTSSIQSVQDATLYPGMTATVNIVSAQANNVAVIPNTALSFGPTAIRDGLVKFQRPGGPGGQTRAPGGANAANRGAARGPGGANAANRAGQAGGRGGFAGAFAANGGNPTRGIVVVMRNGKLAIVPVGLGLTDGSVTQVSSGLNPGETIVVGAAGLPATSAPTTGPGGPGGRRGPGGPGFFFRGG